MELIYASAKAAGPVLFVALFVPLTVIPFKNKLYQESGGRAAE